MEKLPEEPTNSGRVVEESKQQLASLPEAKLASPSQATREEDGQQLAQAPREQAQVMHEAADVKVETIKPAAQQPFRQSTTWRGYLHGVETLLARARRIPAQIQTRKWIFSRKEL